MVSNNIFYQRKQELLGFIKKNPSTTIQVIRDNGLYYHLHYCYNDNISNARKEAGIDYEEIINSKRKLKRGELLLFLRENPNAVIKDLPVRLYNLLNSAYKCRINDLRRDLNLPIKKVRRYEKKEKEQIKKELLDYLKNKPETSYNEIIAAGLYRKLHLIYKGNITAARKDAGLSPHLIKEIISRKREEKTTGEEKIVIVDEDFKSFKEREKEVGKKIFLDYLIENKDLNLEKITELGFEPILSYYYSNDLSKAYGDAIKRRREWVISNNINTLLADLEKSTK